MLKEHQKFATLSSYKPRCSGNKRLTTTRRDSNEDNQGHQRSPKVVTVTRLRHRNLRIFKDQLNFESINRIYLFIYLFIIPICTYPISHIRNKISFQISFYNYIDLIQSHTFKLRYSDLPVWLKASF